MQSDGLGIDLDDHPAFDGRGNNTPPNGAKLNISGNVAITDLNNDIAGIPAQIAQAIAPLNTTLQGVVDGTGINTSGLMLDNNAAFSTLRTSVEGHVTMAQVLGNITIQRLRLDITNLESDVGVLRGDVNRLKTANERMSADLDECKLMIRRMTPLGEIIEGKNLSQLLERGVTTVVAASDLGQEGLAKMISSKAAEQLMTEVNNHLQVKQ